MCGRFQNPDIFDKLWFVISPKVSQFAHLQKKKRNLCNRHQFQLVHVRICSCLLLLAKFFVFLISPRPVTSSEISPRPDHMQRKTGSWSTVTEGRVCLLRFALLLRSSCATCLRLFTRTTIFKPKGGMRGI